MASIARLGVALLASALLSTGCGEAILREVAADAPVPNAPAVGSPPPPVRRGGAVQPMVGDTVGLGSGSVTVEAVEAEVQAGRLFKPPAGRQYYAVSVRGCAGSREDGVEFRPEYFTLRLADRGVYEAGLGMKKPELIGATLPAGGCLRGWVTFTIPEDGLPVVVAYDGSQSVKWAVPPPPPPPR